MNNATYKKLRIGEIVQTISLTHKFDKDKLIAINTSDVYNGVMSKGTLTPVKELKGQFKKTIQKDDILFSEIRPANRRFAIVTNSDCSDFVVSTKLMVLRKFNEKVDSSYFYYCLTNQSFLYILQRRAENRIGSFPQITYDLLANYAFPIPPLEEQKRISKIIANIDRKIELNRQINDNLEEQLRLITSRYIFGSPYLKKKRIGEIATIKAGGDCPITFSKTRTQECNIPIFSNGTEDRGLYGFTNKANIEGHSITVAARGTIGYCERRLMPFVPIIRLLAITPKEDGAYIYLHQVIRGMKFKKNGSVQQQLTVPEISFIEIPYPHSSVLLEYNNVANPIVEMIERNINENEILTKQRDELLPLLMNGQASVNYHLSVMNAAV